MSHPLVIGYDGSPCSKAAFRGAIELALESRDPEVVIVYCHEPPPGLACALDPACAAAKELRDYERRIRDDVEPMLDRAAEEARAAGVGAEVVLVWDDPVRALQAVADERGSRVIVVGSHAEGAVAHALRRHTPSELLRRSRMPVMVVPYRS